MEARRLGAWRVGGYVTAPLANVNTNLAYFDNISMI